MGKASGEKRIASSEAIARYSYKIRQKYELVCSRSADTYGPQSYDDSP